MHQATLEARRNREREKYVQLSGKRCLLLGGMRYGASNHGRGAIPIVIAWRPRFVADFGCGDNAFIRALRNRGVKGVGIDFANPSADVQAPMHRVPLEDRSADVVTCFDALEHLLPEDVDSVLDEMHRIAGQGGSGRFIFSICTRPSMIRVNGENLHPTVRPLIWWLRRISRVAHVADIGRRYIRGCWR